MPRLTMLTAARVLALAAALASASCDGDKPAAPDAAKPPASASARPLASSASNEGEPRERRGRDQEPQSVYPVTNDPPDPRAEKLCDALNTVPVKRKAECCAQSPGVMQTRECVRMLSAALRSGAVTVADADIDACSAAMTSKLEGCGWVSLMLPPAPPACLGIVHGARKSQETCRSSLECQDGLRCIGVGPTQPGTCGPPLANGNPCGLAVDPLAGMARQTGYEEKHPECAGYCGQRKCEDPVAIGGACTSSAACGRGASCASGKCAREPLPSVGQACPGGECAGEGRCVKGQCSVPKNDGEPCETNRDCFGTCSAPDGGAGRCMKKCVIEMPK